MSTHSTSIIKKWIKAHGLHSEDYEVFLPCRSLSLRISFTVVFFFFFFSLLLFYLRLNHHCGIMLSFVTALLTYFHSTAMNGCVSDHMLS